jgi:hypothetical protein
MADEETDARQVWDAFSPEAEASESLEAEARLV